MTQLHSSSFVGQGAEDRVKAVVEFGFTERQARFLVTVMLHSGVCLMRQFTAFAGIVHGQKTRKFFAKLVRRKFATAYPCRHHRGRVYHVHHKALYRAIGQTESSRRRPMAAARVVDSLVLLDAMLATPSVVWLALPEDKAAHLSSLAGVGPAEANRATRAEGTRETARAVRDRMPIGIDPDGRWLLVYVVAGDQLEDFHWFVQRHAPVLAALPAWTLRVVFAADLRWLRRAHNLEHAPIDDQEGYDEAHYAFKATRFQVLYGGCGTATRHLTRSRLALLAMQSGAAPDGSNATSCRSHIVISPPWSARLDRQGRGPRRATIAPHRLSPLWDSQSP